VVLILVSSLRYPAIFRLPGAGLVLTLTVVMLLGYAACGLWALRHPAAGHQTGLAWGALAGAMWSAEIWCGGPAKLPHSAEQALGASFVVLAVVATVTDVLAAAAAHLVINLALGLLGGGLGALTTRRLPHPAT